MRQSLPQRPPPPLPPMVVQNLRLTLNLVSMVVQVLALHRGLSTAIVHRRCRKNPAKPTTPKNLYLNLLVKYPRRHRRHCDSNTTCRATMMRTQCRPHRRCRAPAARKPPALPCPPSRRPKSRRRRHPTHRRRALLPPAARIQRPPAVVYRKTAGRSGFRRWRVTPAPFRASGPTAEWASSHTPNYLIISR